jgi:hypothetical protein
MSPTLNLTDYDTQQSFEAMPPGKYYASIFDAEDRETQGGENAKMPAGTPMIFCHFQITGKVGETEVVDEQYEYYNRRQFRNLVVPPEDYDPKKRKSMNGMIVALYQAAGYSLEEITSGDFTLDTEDLVEKQLVIQLSRRMNNMTKSLENSVVGFYSIEAAAGTEAAASSQLL